MSVKPVCPGCGTELAAALLACPACNHLVHSDRLKDLMAEARQAEEKNELLRALECRREALSLLPPDTHQFARVEKTVSDLSRRIQAMPASTRPTPVQPGRGPWVKAAAGLGGIGLLVWKLKFILGFALTKGKLLLLGLTKWSTLMSMLLSTGVYWAAWGWKFGVGLVVSIYIHEMGHVAALRRYGIAASAPMFIPGVGAMIRLKQTFMSPEEDARVGLAGPMWGMGAALVAYGISLAAGWPSLAAIARVGAWINLFNLLPVWQLDGGRAFNAFNRKQQWCAALVLLVLWVWTEEGLLALLLFCAAGRALIGRPVDQSDWPAFFRFSLVALALSAMTLIVVPQVV